MTTTPLPPAIEPVAWFEYARKKPTLKRLVFDRTSRSQLRVAGWVSEPLVKESDATQARADLEAENARLREALQVLVDNGGNITAMCSKGVRTELEQLAIRKLEE